MRFVILTVPFWNIVPVRDTAAIAKLVGYYKKYDINLSADDIIITTGGSEAVLFAFLSCLNPGDEIIVPEPAYANYMAFAISAGAVIRTVTTTIEEGFSCRKWRSSRS